MEYKRVQGSRSSACWVEKQDGELFFFLDPHHKDVRLVAAGDAYYPSVFEVEEDFYHQLLAEREARLRKLD